MTSTRTPRFGSKGSARGAIYGSTIGLALVGTVMVFTGSAAENATADTDNPSPAATASIGRTAPAASAEALSANDPSGEQRSMSRTSDMSSARDLPADAPEVVRIKDLLRAQDSYAPSANRAAKAAPGESGQKDSEVLNAKAVAAVDQVATRSARAETLAGFAEFEHQDWQQQGTPTVIGQPSVVSLPVAEQGNKGDSIRVTVCLDSSKVTVVDRDGNVVQASQPNRRVLHNYDLIRENGQNWQITAHGFPADPTC